MSNNDVKFSIVDDTHIKQLLKTISKILTEKNSNTNLDSISKEWYWQYKNPSTGKSFVYAAWINNEIIGYYHIATNNFIINRKKFLIGNIQDVAILEKFRGKGIFRKLAEFANNEINKHVDILYTFPNRASINTFLKYNNFKLISSLPVYLLPLKIQNIIRTKFKFLGLENIFNLPFKLYLKLKKSKLDNLEKIVLINDFDDSICNVFEKFNQLHSSYLLRNKEFLNWRYKESPKGNFYIFALKKNNEINAVIIVKREKINKNEACIIIDFAFKNNVEDLKKLLSNFCTIPNKNFPFAPDFLILAGLSPFLNHIKKCGLISVPQFLIPRKIKLLTRITEDALKNDDIKYASWLVTLGDWDIF